MLISNNKPIAGVVKAYGEQNKIGKAGQSGRTQGGRDAVELSSSAQGFAQILGALKKVPDVREDLVSNYKSQIENGTYRVDAQAIANSMLGKV